MKLYIIRHGESYNNKLGTELEWSDYLVQRLPDPPLTPLGERQADAVATHLSTAQAVEHHLGHRTADGYGITRIYCSAMLRAMQTAQPIQRELGIDPEVVTMIHEQGGLFTGDPSDYATCVGYPGMSRTEMQERFPRFKLPEDITEEGWWRGSHEPMESCSKRAQETSVWLGELAEQFAAERSDEHVALVVHADFIDQLLKALLGHMPGTHFRYIHNNTAITTVEFGSEGRRRLHYVNRTQHLTPELFTSSNE